MGARVAGPGKTLTVRVAPRGENRSGRLEVPIDRIEAVYGHTHRRGPFGKSIHSWVALKPVEAGDPLEPYMFVGYRREDPYMFQACRPLEIQEAHWEVAASLTKKGVDLVRVHERKDTEGNRRGGIFAVRDQVVAVVPTAVDVVAELQDSQGHGCVVLRSGSKLTGYKHPETSLIGQVFGDNAVIVPTSSGDQAAVLPEFYRGSAGYNTQGRLMFGIVMGDAPDARTMRAETRDYVQDIPGALAAGEQHLESLATRPQERVLA
jgi:hypothetical protein